MTAARKLEPLVTPDRDHDPVLAAFLRAPLSAEPLTDEERAACDVGMADIRAGRTVSHDEVLAAIEQMRREQGE